MSLHQVVRGTGTVVIAALTLVALSGCGGEENQASVEEQIKELASSAPESQRQMLADGRVLTSEYETAVFAELDCVEQAGFVVDDLVWREGQFGFSSEWSGEIDAEQDARNFDVLGRCKDEHSRIVARAANLQDAPTASERDALRPAVVQCLRTAGVELDDDSDDQNILGSLRNETNNAAAVQCTDEHYQYFIAGDE